MELSLGALLVEQVVGIAVGGGLEWLKSQRNQQTFLDVFVKAFERSLDEYRMIYSDIEGLSPDKNRLQNLMTGRIKTSLDLSEMSSDDRIYQISNLLNQHHVLVGNHQLTEEEVVSFIIRIIRHAEVYAGQLIDRDQTLSNSYSRQSLDALHSKVDLLVANQFDQSETSNPPQVSIDLITIRQHFFDMSAGLRHEYHTIGSTGIELQRKEFSQVIEWLQKTYPGKRTAAIAGKRGYGKTVLARSLYNHFDNLNYATLGIRADRFQSTIKYTNEIFGTSSLADVIKTASLEMPVFVIIDQLDRLASTANSDPENLYMVIDFINMIKDIPQAYLIIVCREFELNNDPVLQRIQINQKFVLQHLSVEEVNRILDTLIQQKLSDLPLPMQSLLREPITLTNYADLIVKNIIDSSETFYSLYQLYSRRWTYDIAADTAGIPSYQALKSLIFQLVEEMNNRRSYEAPARLLDDHRQASIYLQSLHYIEVNMGQVSFNHQTLYSYCYARWFVELGKELHQEIISGCQGFYERPKMEILEYLRIEDSKEYSKQLRQLLDTDNFLRTHLRLLIIQRLADQIEPLEFEKDLVVILMQQGLDRKTFIEAIRNKTQWFELVQPFVKQLLDSKSSEDNSLALNYLYSFSSQKIDEIVALLQAYTDKAASRTRWLVVYLRLIDDWNSKLAIDSAKRLIISRQIPPQEFTFMLHAMSTSNLSVGCELLGLYLMQQLNERTQFTDYDSLSESQDNLNPVRNYYVCHFAKLAIKQVPIDFVNNMLEWFQIVAAQSSNSVSHPERYYPRDMVFRFSEENQFGGRDVPNLDISLVEAFKVLVSSSPHPVKPILAKLGAVELHFNQALVAQIYLAYPEDYSSEIYHFLTSDKRRLFLDYASRLVGRVFQFWGDKQRTQFEILVRNLKPMRFDKPERRQYLWIQEDMLRLLFHVPKELLSVSSYRFVMMLRRKFPNFRPERSGFGSFEATKAPVSLERLRTVSDADYHRIMKRYDDSTDWDNRSHFGGGVVEQSRVVAEHAKEDPEKLYRIALKFMGNISEKYVSAIISGLVSAEDTPSEWIRALIARAGIVNSDYARSEIARGAKSRPDSLGDNEILELLLQWSIGTDDPERETMDLIENRILTDTDDRRDGWINRAINSSRGNALEALINSMLERKNPKTDLLWDILQKFVDDPSIAIRCVALNGLAGWQSITRNTEATVELFRQYVARDPLILTCHYAQNLLNWVAAVEPEIARVYLLQMLNMEHEWTREVAAQIICVNAFRQVSLQDLADKVLRSDDTALRRGAASIYARNLASESVASICEERLRVLMQDEDEQVQRYVGDTFHHLNQTHLLHLGLFIEEFASSPAANTNPDALIQYLIKIRHQRKQYDYVLQIIITLLENIREMLRDDITQRPLIYGDELLQFLRNIYESYDDLCDIVMDIFDFLIEHDNRNAKQLIMSEDREWI